MMPAQGRSPAPSLPPVDDEATIPLSDLIKSGFDSVTVDSTTKLADQSIFVTSDGRRYRFERIPDPPPAPGRVPISAPVPSPPAPPISFATPSRTFSGSPASLPPPQLHVHAPDSAPGWGRSPSNASSHSYSSGTYSARSGQVPGLGARVSAHEITSMMTHLNIDRFGAAPLYGESDGGVQAAETLTDPYVAPRASPISPASPSGLSTSPRISFAQQQPPPPPPQYQAPGWAPDDYPNPGHVSQWISPDYGSYTHQTNAHLSASRQKAVTSTGLPSLMEGAVPVTSPHRASDPISAVSPLSPDQQTATWANKDVRGGQGAGSRCYNNHPLHHSVSAPPSFLGRQSTTTYVNCGPGDIDTQTPVVVVQQHHAPSTVSDGASTARDNVLPGEDMLFDGPVKSAQSLTAPVFRDGVLKVFRNTLTSDLRFHCKVDHESETFWMKANNAQLVPAYAYDPRLSNVVYIRDKESSKGNGYVQASQGNCRPSGIYQFSSLKELFDFQAKLTGEKVVLDIGSVRMVTLSRAKSRSSTQFSSARLQIWHEEEGRNGAQSDVASFVTAGTALSGPLRRKVVPTSSRLVIYLGRSGDYITAFITDDLEIKADGQTLVKLKPRSPFSRNGSRWPWVKAHLETSRSSEPAGLDIHGRPVEVDIDSEYDSYKTFDIEFENSPSQDGFIRKWNEVMKERRLQRERLKSIQDEMDGAVFTGRQARAIF